MQESKFLQAIEYFLLCVFSAFQKNIAQLACNSSIFEGQYQTTRPGCSDFSGFILLEEDQQGCEASERGTERWDCKEWLVGHMCWCLLAMHLPSAEGKEATKE